MCLFTSDPGNYYLNLDDRECHRPFFCSLRLGTADRLSRSTVPVSVARSKKSKNFLSVFRNRQELKPRYPTSWQKSHSLGITYQCPTGHQRLENSLLINGGFPRLVVKCLVIISMG